VTIPDIIGRINAEFTYLFDVYDYRVIAHRLFANQSNWIVVLQSPSCGRLLLMQDRGEIIVALGPNGDSTHATAVPWFDLGVVVEYLSAGADQVDSVSGHPDHQLAQLAGTLLPYMEQVLDLFGKGHFELVRGQLDRIGSRRERELEEN
jgi:hypothetical protein